MAHYLDNTFWDVLIVGGGATGVGVAIDSANRGLKTLLVEQYDFGKGTSSKSTKLIHGGVRYLQQGNISLVYEALNERAILRKNAPHIVSDLKFVVPLFKWWETPFYGAGLKLYDMLAGKHGLGSSEFLSKEETVDLLPTIDQKELNGGVLYFDGQFDDMRLLISMVKTAEEQGAEMLNYCQLLDLEKDNEGKIIGAKIKDVLGQEDFSVSVKTVINATGVFSDKIRLKDDVKLPTRMLSSRGVHIVLDKSFLPGETAIMIPSTDDGRVLFAVPWHGKVLVGTTDVAENTYDIHPKASEEEIEFLISHISKYLTKDPIRKDIKSVFAGLRPLVKKEGEENSSALSREHQIEISKSGLISIMGGKWTTYRKMAEDTVDKLIEVQGLSKNISCATEELKIHGYSEQSETLGVLSYFGTAVVVIDDIKKENEYFSRKLHPDYHYTLAQILYVVRYEKARTVEDVLARRIRLLFLDVEASIQSAKIVASIMANELNYDSNWEMNQVAEFKSVAKYYQA